MSSGGPTIRRFKRFQREPDNKGPKINRRIRAREVMVVGADGINLGVMPTDIAIKRAEEAGLDLVEVAPESRPPVCKILDFGKYKYLQKKKQAEAKRNQTLQDLKEVKLRPKTDDHDYDFKVKHCRRFLEAGDKVKVTIMFRGREVIHKEIAIKRLMGISVDVEDLAKVEARPKMEGRTMHMILAPKPSVVEQAKRLAAEDSSRKAAAAKERKSEKAQEAKRLARKNRAENPEETAKVADADADSPEVVGANANADSPEVVGADADSSGPKDASSEESSTGPTPESQPTLEAETAS